MEGGAGHDGPLAGGLDRSRADDTASTSVEQPELSTGDGELRRRILEQTSEVNLVHETQTRADGRASRRTSRLEDFV